MDNISIESPVPTKQWNRRHVSYTPGIAAKVACLGKLRKDDLIANESPGSSSVRRLGELIVKPIFLVRTH